MEVITELLSDNKNLALALLSFLVTVFMWTIHRTKKNIKLDPKTGLNMERVRMEASLLADTK